MSQEEAKRLAKEKGWGRGEQNTFQHSYWMATMRLYGLTEEEALIVGVAHELDHQWELNNDGTPHRPQPWGGAESRRDMHNNLTGLAIARRVIDENERMLSREVMLVETLPEALVAAMDPQSCGSVCLKF